MRACYILVFYAYILSHLLLPASAWVGVLTHWETGAQRFQRLAQGHTGGKLKLEFRSAFIAYDFVALPTGFKRAFSHIQCQGWWWWGQSRLRDKGKLVVNQVAPRPTPHRYSNCGPWTILFNSTWELVKNAETQASPQAYRIWTCILTY